MIDLISGFISARIVAKSGMVDVISDAVEAIFVGLGFF